MTDFNIGDWVEIRHTPDLRWDRWYDSHTLFCGRIGYIDSIDPDDIDYITAHNTDEDIVKVVVWFSDTAFQNPGNYFTFFKKRHLIKSSEYSAKRYEFAEEAAKETNDFEAFTCNKRDEIFRYIFGIKEKEEVEEVADDLVDRIFEDWEIKTAVT